MLIQTHRITLTLILFLAQAAWPQSESISPEEYSARRERLIELLDSSSAVVMKASDMRMRSNDVNYQYRQESNFLYLTGIREPNNYLLVAPKGIQVDGKTMTVVLFVPRAPNAAEFTTSRTNEVFISADRFSDVFKSVLPGITTLYLSAPDIGFANDWLNAKPLFIERTARKELEQNYEGLKIKPIGALTGKLRGIKSLAEVRLIQKAIDITADGLKRAMKICAPGKWEYELQAEVEYELTRKGAEYHSFPSIIGSGENSLILHYDKNRRRMKQGDVVVMDVGAEYQGYAADITRTIPVSGKFTKAQKEVYSIALQAQREVIQMIRPGLPYRELDKKTRDIITVAGYGKYIRHGVSHGLGIDVHDMSGLDTLRPGMVITIEPGIYIPTNAEDVKPEYRGFGIRIEDDVLVTETGYELLSKVIPKEIRDIEKLMKK